MPEAAVDWNGANTETLKAMWTAGNSASQIAVVIPNATRSGVLGKVMRLKLPPRDKGHSSPGTGVRVRRAPMSAAPASPRPRHNITRLQAAANGHDKAPPQRRNPTNSLAEKIAIAKAEPGLSPILRGEAPDGTGIQLRELTDLNCHFPKGDPLESDFEFCGRKAIPGMPYCAGHSRIAYAPPKARVAADNWALHRADTKS